jgi:hypothetical protein
MIQVLLLEFVLKVPNPAVSVVAVLLGSLRIKIRASSALLTPSSQLGLKTFGMTSRLNGNRRLGIPSLSRIMHELPEPWKYGARHGFRQFMRLRRTKYLT